MSADAIDRRPIAARSARPIIWATHACIRLRISPNTISVGGVIIATLGGTAMALRTEFGPSVWLVGAAALGLRSLANVLDGMVAVEAGRRSPTGEIWNDLPDRISDVALLGGAGLGSGSPWLAASSAALALFVSYARVLGKACGATSAWQGPMAKPHRMAVLAVAGLGAYACGLAGANDRERLVMNSALGVVVALAIVTLARRLRVIGKELHREESQREVGSGTS